jgi:hypothetical protein
MSYAIDSVPEGEVVETKQSGLLWRLLFRLLSRVNVNQFGAVPVTHVRADGVNDILGVVSTVSTVSNVSALNGYGVNPLQLQQAQLQPWRGRIGSQNISIVDHDRTAAVDFTGKLRTVDPYRVSGATFVGTTVDPNFWTAAVSGTGVNTQANSLLTMTSGTGAAGRATFKSVRSGRFIFYNPMVVRHALRIPTLAVADNTRRWGAFTDSSGATVDGFYFEVSATGALSVNTRNAGGTVNTVASGSFNGDYGSTYTLDTNVHAYEIHYFVMRVEFWVDGKLLHSMVPTTANLSAIYSLPINQVTINGATGGEAGVIEVWATNMVRLGKDSTQPRSHFNNNTTTAGTVLKYGAGQIHQLEISNVSANSAITLYDNTAASGTVIWASGAMNATTQPFNIDLHEVPFENGLTLVVATASCNCSVVYE